MQTKLKLLGRAAAWLWLPLPVLLLAWVLSRVPTADIWAVLRSLRPVSLMLLAGVNLAIFLLLSSRWWLILRLLGSRISLLAIATYRLAAFSITYFTPGPQIGGEPYQIYLLRNRHRISGATALASVSLDKLLELLANFTFLVLGLLVIVEQRIFEPATARQILVLAAILLSLPAGYLLALWKGSRPLTGLSRRLPGSWTACPAFLKTFLSIGKEAEAKAAAFCRDNPQGLLKAVGMSVLIWAAMILEYYLCLRLLGVRINLSQAIMALTAARLAFLLPMPAGLGTLEASQVLALQAMGFSPAAGISAALLIRGRDLLLAGAGLWLTGVFTQTGRREAPPKEFLPGQAGD